MNETMETPAAPAGMEAVAEVPAAHGGQPGSVLAVSDKMVGLTWLAFLIAPASRSTSWRGSRSARRWIAARTRSAKASRRRGSPGPGRPGQGSAEDADGRGPAGSAALVERARAAAAATAQAVETAARAEAETLVRDARTEIGQAKEKALVELRREAADLALQVAGRVLEQKLDAAADRELTERLIRELK
jgi:hypothetical protein